MKYIIKQKNRVECINRNGEYHGFFTIRNVDIVLSAKCWIGMNSVILPGVFLGENTVVAAGSVVTKSFPQGYCIVGGVPAKVIKVIEKHEDHIEH